MSLRSAAAALREPEYDETGWTQKAFRDLLSAFAEPAQWLPLRHPEWKACPAPLDPSAFMVLKTLADPLVGLWVSPLLGADAAGYLRWNTGARAVEPREADYALVVPGDGPLPADFRLGDEEFPERSTLLIVQHPPLDQGGVRAEVRGPGIRESRVVEVSPAAATLVEAGARLGNYPLGIDLILVRPDGRICALPRTLEITWLT